MSAPRLLNCAVLWLSWGLGGCGLSLFGAHVETSKTVAGPPSDVTVHVTVEDTGEPVGYLSANNFSIYENDVLLNEAEIGLRLLSREKAAAGLTVLLLDLSGSPSELELTRFSRGAAHFIEKVSTTQAVTVVAFDGSDRAREVGRFAKVGLSTKRPLPPLKPFLSRDASRDLNSAMVAAITGLSRSLKALPGEVHYGNIVTLVRGPDLAGRKTDKEVRAAMKGSGFEFFSLAPEGLSFSTLGDIGKDERFTYKTLDELPMRFQDLGIRVRAAWQSHYLVSYCSPARAGIRKLRVKVKYESESGSVRSANSKSEFDASGFTGGCVPKTDGTLAPVLVMSNDAPSPETDSAAESEPPESTAPPQPLKPSTGPKPSPRPSPEDQEEDGPVVAPPSSGKYE